jgi:aryl-alcohol dehydrogenase-like predicted oxidoreductase
MDYRLLGGSGFKVPVICLGTGTFGGGNAFFRAMGNSGVEEATRLVDVAIGAGANMFDSSDIYSDGLAEEILGKAIAGRRDSVIISTKATFRLGPGPNDVGSSRYHLIKACEGSLRRLGTDYIDLYQMHGFDALTPVDEVLGALDDLVRSGKVRYIGCSNFSGWHLMKSLAASDRLRVGALRGAPGLLFPHRQGLRMGADAAGAGPESGAVVWSPLGWGRLTGKIRRGHPYARGQPVPGDRGPGSAHDG